MIKYGKYDSYLNIRKKKEKEKMEMNDEYACLIWPASTSRVKMSAIKNICIDLMLLLG